MGVVEVGPYPLVVVEESPHIPRTKIIYTINIKENMFINKFIRN